MFVHLCVLLPYRIINITCNEKKPKKGALLESVLALNNGLPHISRTRL